MSENHEKVCRALNYFGHFLIFVSTVSDCFSISAFASLIGVPVGIKSSTVRITICTIAAGIKKHKSMIKKKRKKHDQMVLLAKTKLNTIEALISKALINSYINHGNFCSVNNVLWKYNEIKKEIKNP